MKLLGNKNLDRDSRNLIPNIKITSLFIPLQSHKKNKNDNTILDNHTNTDN